MSGFDAAGFAGLRAEAGELLPELQALRRRLHGEAEVGLRLPTTQATILQQLAGLGLEVTTGSSLSSVTAVLRGGAAGADPPVVLLRSDMDALPLTEESGEDFAATGSAMHACGHDLHQAGLIGAARLLAAHRDELPGTVVLMFQPGEEGYAGGQAMIDEGVLTAAGSPPVAAYAVHVDSQTPAGLLVTRPGPIMAGVAGLRIRIVGTGGHAAAPHLAVDPVPVAADVIQAVQAWVARSSPVAEPVVASIGPLRSDSPAGNVLATSVEMEANLRFFGEESEARLREGLVARLRAVIEAAGCQAELTWIPSYPACVNDPAETEGALAALTGAFGEDGVAVLPEPAMASEDFAYVLRAVPGVLVFLGASAPGMDPAAAAPMHSPTVVFVDAVLAQQAAVLAGLAWRRLAAEVD